MLMTAREEMKLVLREADIPFFTDEELDYYLGKHEGNVNEALYDCLIVKSQDTSLKTNELELGDTSNYFRRLASRYRPSHSGTLLGV
jgi:hypothetical protein